MARSSTDLPGDVAPGFERDRRGIEKPQRHGSGRARAPLKMHRGYMLSNSRESGIICVVDDDEGVRKSFRRYLEVKGLSVRDYCSGEVFLAEMHAPSIGCLVLDFHLRGSTGLEILIRSRSQGWMFPVIMMTGHQSSSLEEQALRSGARAVLRKPIEPHVLFSTIEKALAAKQAV